MKQIHEAVQALESDIGFWRPSWILLKKLKNAKKFYREHSLGLICILQIGIIRAGVHVHSYITKF